MTRRARWWRLAGGAGVVLAAGYGLLRLGLVTTPSPAAPGAPAPDFSAVTIDSVPSVRTLADYRGSPMLLNVWATWCDPCRDEMPSMQRLYEATRDRGLRIVAISIDDRGNAPLIREFAAEHHLTFDILHDPTSAIMKSYQVRGVPQSFLISRTGQIVGIRFVADWSSPANRQLIDSLLLGGDASR